MRQLLIIIITMLAMYSCEDNDSFFGPPADVADNISDHINHYRLMNGINALASNADLVNLANEHSEYMAINQSIDHSNQSSRYNYVVDNLSMGKYAEIVEAGDLYGRDLIEKWAGNESKQDILLGDFEYIGIGIYDVDDQKYATIIFTK